MEAIRAEGLTKTLDGRTVVDGIDLSVREGEILGFVGPNGAGKTTTWSMLTGLWKPTAGSVRLLGRPVDVNDASLKRQLGIVADQSHLFEGLTGQELLFAYGRLYGLRGPETERRVDELLSAFDLDASRNQTVATFSNGMKKKIRLAAAILHGPRVVFLDEPFEGMDAASVRVAMRILKEMANGGAAVFLTSHRLDYVERLSTHLAVIKEGRILLACTGDEFRKAFDPSVGEGGVGRLENLLLKISGVQPATPLSWLRPCEAE